MGPRPGIRQPPGEQLPQGQLNALLLTKLAPALGRDLLGARHQARAARRGALEQLLHPKAGRKAVGQLVVETGMPTQQVTPFEWTLDRAHGSIGSARRRALTAQRMPGTIGSPQAHEADWIPKR